MPKRKRTPLHDTINPLSHNETTIKQLHVAGLTENDLLPSTYIPGFPHRPIRPSHLPPEEEDDDEDGNASPSKQKDDHRRRLAAQRSRDAQEQHLGVLKSIILRSLSQDNENIPRAKRAFGLLWRTQVRGKPVDLRRQGLWTLGAEILMRDGSEGRGRRWGATGNMPQLRGYLECLVRQYPYNRLHPTSISDLDFYPVLFGCEMYDVWVEHKLALERLEVDAETWSDGDMKLEDDSDDNDDELHLPARERHLRDEKARLKNQALAIMRGLAARMDSLMENAPYNRSVEMLRLRGMVALYVGDLSVPPWPRTEQDEEAAQTIREEERNRAKALFVKMKECSGGVVDVRVQRWLDDDDEDDDDAYEDSDDALPVFSSLPIR